ncbi:MAG: hypothetical protein ACLRWM_04360 [Streptococcus sp.]
MTKEMTNSQNILTNIAYLQTKIPQYLQHLSNREEAKYLYIDYTMTATMMKMVIIR